MAAARVALLIGIVLAASPAFAGGTGIDCGWQPMPDGTASYECVVQVDTELLDALRRGDSIPLTVDVPEHIRPISRIRLVAGDLTVPRQSLAQSLKAWPQPEKEPRDGVVETQFTTSNNDPRYGNQQSSSGAVVPLNGYVSQAQDELARQLQNGEQALREAAGQMTQDVLPPDPGRSVTNAVDRAGQELGNDLRSASDSVQNDIRQLFGNESASGSTSQILPPSEQQRGAILPGVNTSAGNTPQQASQPMNSAAADRWQSTQPQPVPTAANAPNNVPNNFNSPWPSDARAQPQDGNGIPPAPGGARYSSEPPIAGNASPVLPQNARPTTSAPGDLYGNSRQTAPQSLSAADSRSGTIGSPQSAGAGPSFPAFTPTLGNEQSQITPTPMFSSSTPEIRRNMLSQPANADIQGANGFPIGQQPINPTQGSQTASPPPGPGPSNFGWDTKPQAQQSGPQQPASPVGATSNSLLPLLLSWVLLSGSGAGNLYLFWSYLDVRNKYRDLVDEAARRISGRRARD